MKLPNGDQANLGDKLERYCLNPEHSKGKHKALLFEKRLGITLNNKEILKNSLKKAAIEGEVEVYKSDQYGTHYDLIFTLQTELGKSRWVPQKKLGWPLSLSLSHTLSHTH